MKYPIVAACLLVNVLVACHRADERRQTYVDAAGKMIAMPSNVPLGLPPVPVLSGNPPTQARIDLGRKLFMDRRLSPNDTMSCAMCHIPEQGFTSNMLAIPVGFEGRSLRRNAPTILNVAYVQQLFHDGREPSLANQVWGPLLTANEMGNPTAEYVIEKIRTMPDYRQVFEAAFDGVGPTRETIGAALASYERTLVSGNSRFDRWRSGQQSAMNRLEQAGFKVFSGKANCIACHIIGQKSALFADGHFHNTGIGWARSTRNNAAKHAVELLPGTVVEVDERVLQGVSNLQQGDMGRYEVTHRAADSWAYRTPSLRNIAITGPYMHDGSLSTLEEVVDFYVRGGIDNPYKDPLLKPLQLSVEEKRDLISFLHALTGDNVKKLADEARAEPID